MRIARADVFARPHAGAERTRAGPDLLVALRSFTIRGGAEYRFAPACGGGSRHRNQRESFSTFVNPHELRRLLGVGEKKRHEAKE
jgi:hypothetical protein